MSSEVRNSIDEILACISVDEFLELGEWCEFLHRFCAQGVDSVFERDARCIDVSDVRELDRFLIRARKYSSGSKIFRELLEHGIKAAVETSDDSLVETVTIVLADKIINYDELYLLAMSKSRTNKNIHRVLYNVLREKVPGVRGYIGDGNTRSPW